MSEGINVVSFFDGMGCLYIALKELGIKVNKYFSYEIDKHAIKQTKHNFPDIIHLGSIENFHISQLQGLQIHLVGAGSPCQGFSFAGKQLNFEDPRSKLFFNFVDCLKDIQKKSPSVMWLLENVVMKKEHQRVINKYMGLYPCNIDSNLVSAQNRSRLYWSNIKTKKEGLFGEVYTDIPQPKDRKIYLKDILQPENEVDEKYYIKNPKYGFEGMNINGKDNNFRVDGGCSQSKKHNYDIIKLDKSLNIKPNQDKASCFTAGGHSGGNHSDMDIICVAMRGRNLENPSDRSKGASLSQVLEMKTDGKTNCITNVSKDNLIMQLPRGNNIGGFHSDKSPTVTSNSWEQNNLLIENNFRVTQNIKGENEKPNCFLSTSYKGSQANGMTNIVTNDYKLRRLTTVEASRLQNIPDWYEWVCSSSQIYRMVGNGWTIETIKHILSFLPEFFLKKIWN
jgi:DNA-cytosine methyltransferase